MSTDSPCGPAAGPRKKPVAVVLPAASCRDPVARFAARALQDHLVGEGVHAVTASRASGPGARRIRLAVDPKAVGGGAPPESFRITTAADGSLAVAGTDGPGLLWGVRDVQHYYARAWLEGLAAGKPVALDRVSSPAIQNRGLWSWHYGCYDPFAFVDRASEWKINTIVFWNRGVPMNAARLNAYAHERGVRIWWGFSWGWVAADFRDASPKLAEKLMALYEKQKREINPKLQNLDLLAPETPGALMAYVLDVFEKQYAWIPDIDGIYFQSATEAVNPRLAGKTKKLGEALMRNIGPIIRELHRRYPKLKISCGIHNTGNAETYAALKEIPAHCNILWEEGVTWAPSADIARRQMKLRGAPEDYAGLFRITMNCGMVFRDQWVQGERDRVWLHRVDRLWECIEEGRNPGGGKPWPFVVDGKPVGYPCAIDWRPPKGKRVIDNHNFRKLLDWSRMLVKGPPRTKGLFLLVEAGLIDLKMRRVPAMAAEAIWNPQVKEAELERRCRMIWQRRVGGWRASPNPYWRASEGAPLSAPPPGVPEDLGDVYEQMGK